MIIEKIYSNESEICKSDIEKIQNLVEKYEIHEIFDALNKLNKNNINEAFNKTGGSTVHGLSGILQSIPSFAITALISPTVAVLAGLGALSHRIRERWEDKKSWRNRLMPGFWVDNLANPNPKGSIPHRVISGTGKAVAGAATVATAAALGPLAWPKLKERAEKLKGNTPSWMKKLLGIGAAAGLGSKLSGNKADSSINLGEEYALTPEDVKNIDFKEYWLTLTNKEVLRVKADTPENAKALGQFIVASALLKGGRYEILNKQIEKRHLKRFVFYFDDGEMCYSAGETQKDAMRAASDYRNEICKQINDSDKGLMQIDPLSTPKIYGAEAPKRGALIPLPDRNKIKVSDTAPVKKITVPKKLTVPAYEYEGMEDYKVLYMNCNFHIPAFDKIEAENITRAFVNVFAKQVIEEIKKDASNNFPQFKIKFGDGDFYHLCAPDTTMATSYAIRLHSAKIKSAMKYISKQDPLENFITEYEKIYNKIQSINIVNKNDMKEYKIKEYAKIRRIVNPQDDMINSYEPFKINL